MTSRFISETEALEARKKRQEEWEKVRKPDDPLERPEEPYDSRSLYERLQEQKQKKDLEYEEAHKLKNMIKGLDDDEIEFLDLVDRTKLAADRRKTLEEERELIDYRNRVASLQEKAMENKLQAELTVNKTKTVSKNKQSQQSLLKGVVVKKNESRKRKHNECSKSEAEDDFRKDSCEKQIDTKNADVGKNTSEDKCESEEKNSEENKSICKEKTTSNNTALTCIGILPGIGCYTESSSEYSSDSECEQHQKIQIDILGRKVVKKVKDKDES